MKIFFLIATVLFLSVFFAGAARADEGPKPTIEIKLPPKLEGNVRDGELLLCRKSNCSDSQKLMDIGPQYFYCGQNHCSGRGYGFAPYFQLRLTLHDGRRITSAVFVKKAFDAEFNASLSGDKLIVIEQ